MNAKNELYNKYDLYQEVGDLVAVADDAEKSDFVVLHSMCGWMVGDKRTTLKSMKRRLAKQAQAWVKASPNELSGAQWSFVRLVTH